VQPKHTCIVTHCCGYAYTRVFIRASHHSHFLMHAGKGFEQLFETIDDVAIDVHDARGLASKFLARAVADEVLPPVFLTDPLVQVGEFRVNAESLRSIGRLTVTYPTCVHVHHCCSLWEEPSSLMPVRCSQRATPLSGSSISGGFPSRSACKI
jgi:hypothetical protein